MIGGWSVLQSKQVSPKINNHLLCVLCQPANMRSLCPLYNKSFVLWPHPPLPFHTNYLIIDSIRCPISIIIIFSLTLLAKQTYTNWTQYFFMCNVNLTHIQYVLKNIKISMIWWWFLYTRASFTHVHTLRLLPVFEKNRQIKLHHKARFLG